MATYEERREARTGRLDARRDHLTEEATAHYNAARSAVEHIPFGQPILVGHHSEGAHRAALAKHDRNMRAACDLTDAARHVPTQATTAILADDDDAPDRLRERITSLEALHAKMTVANKLARKGDAAGLAAMGYSEATIANLLHPPYAYLKAGFEPYQMSSTMVNIRRIKERLARLEAVKARPATTVEINGITIEEDPEAVRLRMRFPGKPAPNVIANLKSSGFRWAPSEGAWQRQLSTRARWLAEQIAAAAP